MRSGILTESKDRFLDRLPDIWFERNPDGEWEVPGKRSVFVLNGENEALMIRRAKEILRRYPNWEREIDWNRIGDMPPYELDAKVKEWMARMEKNEARNAARTERRRNPLSMFSDRRLFNCLGMYKGWIAVQPLNHEAAVKLADVSVGGLPGKWCISQTDTDSYWNEYCDEDNRFLMLWNTKRKPGKDYLVKCMVQYTGFYDMNDGGKWKFIWELDGNPTVWTEYDSDINDNVQEDFPGWVADNLAPMDMDDLIDLSERLVEPQYGDDLEDSDEGEDEEVAEGLGRYSNLDYLHGLLSEAKEGRKPAGFGWEALEEMYLKDAILSNHVSQERQKRIEKVDSLPPGRLVCHRVEEKGGQKALILLLSNGVIEIYGIHYKWHPDGTREPYPVFVTTYVASPRQLYTMLGDAFAGLPYEVQGEMDEVASRNKAMGLCHNEYKKPPEPPRQPRPKKTGTTPGQKAFKRWTRMK